MPKPLRIVPLLHRPTPKIGRLSSSAENAAAAAATPQVTHHGGAVLGSVEVVTIFWGVFWTQSPPNGGASLVPAVNDFFDAILTSEFMDALSEYSTGSTQIGYGKRTATLTFTQHEPGTAGTGGAAVVTDEQVQDALEGWIDDGRVPEVNDNSLYFVFLPPNVTSKQNGEKSCTDFCGYHGHDGNTFYAVIPFGSCAGCTDAEDLDFLTRVSSHELAEAVTNPDNEDGWWDPNSLEEIGDICNTTTACVRGYKVQAQWSNARSACVVSGNPSRQSGYFGKWFNDGSVRPEFQYVSPPRFIGGTPGALPGAWIIPCDLNGDGKTDFVVFRASDGYLGKWLNDGNTGPDFRYVSPPEHMFRGSQSRCAVLIPCNLSGTPGTDFVLFKSSSGEFEKIVNDRSANASLQGKGRKAMGGAPGILRGAQLIPCDLNGDGKTDFVVFRPRDGYFAKWFNNGITSPDFQYVSPPRYIGGAPGSLSGAQLIPCDLNGNGKTDFVVFRSSDGYFGKWLNDGTASPDFQYVSPPQYIGGRPGALPGAQLIPCDLNGDGKTDFVVFRSDDGYFGKWFNDGNTGPTFQYVSPPQYIGGAPGKLRGAQLIPCDLNGDGKTDFVVFRSSDGYFAKWFNDGNAGPNFQYVSPPQYIGGTPGALPGAQLIPCDLNGDGKTDFLVFRP